jgi:hypothetical protein
MTREFTFERPLDIDDQFEPLSVDRKTPPVVPINIFVPEKRIALTSRVKPFVKPLLLDFQFLP